MTTTDTLIHEDGFGIVRASVEAGKEENPFQIVRRYTMTNKNDASVTLITWGAGIQSIKIPDNQSILGDVVLGFDSIDGYLQNRYIGRITNQLPVDIEEKNCSSLEDINHTRGTFEPIDNVNWNSYVMDKQVIMSHLSRSRDDEHPGDALIQVKYSWTDENELKVNTRATSTALKVPNLTSYCPINLAGHGMGPKELKNHVVTINADQWNGDKTKKVPTIRNVDRTLFDLRNPTKLKSRLNRIPGGGYNHTFITNSPSVWCYRFHGRILHPASGRFLEIYSDNESLQFSTGDDLPDLEMKYLPDLEDHMWGGCGEIPAEKPALHKEPTNQELEIRGKNGILYQRHCAFVLSPQNIKPCTIYPGKIFSHNMTYKFGAKNKD